MIAAIVTGCCGDEKTSVQIDAETTAAIEMSDEETDNIMSDSLSETSSLYSGSDDENISPVKAESEEEMTEELENEENAGSGEDFDNGEMEYIEIPTLFEQIKIAGFSVDDGDHTEDIMQIASEIMPIIEGYMGNYTGWCYDDHLSWDGSFNISYLVKGNGNTCISYKYDENRISLIVKYYDYEVPIQGYPLIESTIPLPMDYEEVLDTMNIKELVKLTEEKGEPLGDFKISYQFNSQYGSDTWCVICSTDPDIPLSNSNDFSIALYITSISNKQSLNMQFLNNKLVCIWLQKDFN